MNKTTKAVLLSALVFPGIGHLFLKKYLTGAILLSMAFGALYYLVTKSIEIALKITEEIQAANIPLDVESLTELVATQMSAADTQSQSIATTVILVAWVVGIVDSYRIARV